MDDKKPRDYKMATMVLIGVTVAALLVAVVALSLKGREAVPAQGSPAESGMSYYTPKASASQGSAAQPAGDDYFSIIVLYFSIFHSGKSSLKPV